MIDPLVISVEDALAALPVRKSRRWLVTFLHKTKTDPRGRPLYRLAGRGKPVYFDRLIEAMPCQSTSLPAAPRKRRTSTSGERTSGSQWTEAARLLDDPSLAVCETSSSQPLSAENIQQDRRPRLVVSNR